MVSCRGELRPSRASAPGTAWNSPEATRASKLARTCRIGGFAHAAPQGITEDVAFIGDGLALEAAVAGKGDGLARPELPAFSGLRSSRLALDALPRLGHNLIGLIAELGRNLPVRGQHFGGRENLLLVAGGVRGDLRGLWALIPALLQVLAYLLAARAGGVKILLRVSFDLRRSASAGFDLIAEIAEPVGKLGLVDGSSKLLADRRDRAAARRACCPSSRSVILKMTACVWSCGAA